MIWLTWRQLRGAALMTAAALAVLAAVLGLTGPGLADDYATGIDACAAQGDGCELFVERFFDEHQNAFLAVTALLLVVPALIGIFWGAPLITRELEAGTLRLVWNQGITRTRWLAVKLALTGLAAVTAAGLASLAVNSWVSPIDKTAAENYPRLEPLLFGARGIVPLGHAAFAFALGVAVGMLARRTLPAMAITLAVFAAVQIAMPMLVRPHLAAPTERVEDIAAEDVDGVMSDPTGGGTASIQLNVTPQDAGAWDLSSGAVDASGRTAPDSITVPDSVMDRCPLSRQSPDEGLACLADELNRLGYQKELTYHPASRFWPFQWAETGIYLALATGLLGLSFWWTRRRLT